MVLEAFVSKLKLGLGMSLASVARPTDAESESLDACLEQVICWVEANFGKSYFVKPLADFSAKFGRSFAEDSFYQDRMNYFLEVCILERPLTGSASGLTPLGQFLSESSHEGIASPETWQLFREFRHSLFVVIASSDRQILLRDLQSKSRRFVRPKSGETLKYLDKGTIFQGYVFGQELFSHLGQGVIVHPKSTLGTLKKLIKITQTSRRVSELELMRATAMANMKYLRMQHVDPISIYSKALD